jgi:hypothetical protein
VLVLAGPGIQIRQPGAWHTRHQLTGQPAGVTGVPGAAVSGCPSQRPVCSERNVRFLQVEQEQAGQGTDVLAAAIVHQGGIRVPLGPAEAA